VTRIWIDVEDIFDYAAGNPRPSGIQRLAFEIYSALHRRFGDDGPVRFVRQNATHDTCVTVDWASIAGLFKTMVDEPRPVPAAVQPPAVHTEKYFEPGSPLHRTLRRTVHLLPPKLRVATVRFGVAQLDAVVALGHVLRETARAARSLVRRPKTEHHGTDIAQLAARGDVFLVLGSPWSQPHYADLAQKLRSEFGLQFGLLVYDIIPLRRPEWCDRSLTTSFKAWFDTVLPLCDRIFAISNATARDLEGYARETDLTIPLPVQTIPIGTGFGGEVANGPLRAGLPEAGSYVLFVSTIEARKNHTLLFRVWRRLLEEMPRDHVPTLVFAGRTGWLVADLLQQLRNAANLGGKIVHVHDPTDAELAALYRGCLFTVFPSLYEGWGLPVTESLAFGKPCVISTATSLPEAGGTLARYFDPENIAEATRVIRDTIADRAGLAAWERRVVRDFQPVAWDETAQALMRGLGVAQTASV
jgi:glycosyltransferase involved in cell wall biosynthesis